MRNKIDFLTQGMTRIRVRCGSGVCHQNNYRLSKCTATMATTIGFKISSGDPTNAVMSKFDIYCHLTHTDCSAQLFFLSLC